MHSKLLQLAAIDIIEKRFDLLTKESRRKWEQQFYEVFVQPILTDMGSKLQVAQELVTNDDRQGIYV